MTNKVIKEALLNHKTEIEKIRVQISKIEEAIDKASKLLKKIINKL